MLPPSSFVPPLLQPEIPSISTTTGYLADSEAGHAQVLPNIVLTKSSQNQQSIASNGKNSSTWRSCPRRRRRRRVRKRTCLKACVDCSTSDRWIQRIYSSTPFEASLNSEITTLDDVPRIKELSNKTWREKAPMPHYKPKFDDLIAKETSSDESVSSSCWLRGNHEADEELAELSALVQVVSTLVDECHDSQATYRSYSPQFPD